MLGFFLISLAISNILVSTVESGSRGYSLLISPMITLDGFIHWVFNEQLDIDSSLAKADLDGYVYFLVCVAYLVVAAGWLYRRYQNMSV